MCLKTALNTMPLHAPPQLPHHPPACQINGCSPLSYGNGMPRAPLWGPQVVPSTHHHTPWHRNNTEAKHKKADCPHHISRWALQVHTARLCTARVGGWGRYPPCTHGRNRRLKMHGMQHCTTQTHTPPFSFLDETSIWEGRRWGTEPTQKRGLQSSASCLHVYHARCNALVQPTLGVGCVNFWSFTAAWTRGGGT